MEGLGRSSSEVRANSFSVTLLLPMTCVKSHQAVHSRLKYRGKFFVLSTELGRDRAGRTIGMLSPACGCTLRRPLHSSAVSDSRILSVFFVQRDKCLAIPSAPVPKRRLCPFAAQSPPLSLHPFSSRRVQFSPQPARAPMVTIINLGVGIGIVLNVSSFPSLVSAGLTIPNH